MKLEEIAIGNNLTGFEPTLVVNVIAVIIQIIGYRDGNYMPVPNAGRLYSWSWPNLKKLLV